MDNKDSEVYQTAEKASGKYVYMYSRTVKQMLRTKRKEICTVVSRKTFVGHLYD